MTNNTTITLAYGDGIGPEIMEATVKILKEAGAKINFETIEIGEKVYNKGYGSGIGPDAWDSVYKNKILLKAPITTPQGKGFKSLNVTFRKTLGLFANIRPCMTYPFLQNTTKNMDMVIFRENEEDLYSGVEYRATCNTALSLKLITKQGSERIIRSAFEYAKAHGRKKVTCVTKDNIMKIADGIFHNIFREVKDEYPDIEANHMIVDIGSAKVASQPELFDVVVTLNLYGDIISDIAAEVSGSVGLAGSANMGNGYAMFEAVHGSAPDIAGLDIANPSGLLNAAVMMLEYIGQNDTALKVKNAWIKTLEDGLHTQDIFQEGVSKKLLGTKGFADAVIANLGEKPQHVIPVTKSSGGGVLPEIKPYTHTEKFVGLDVYLNGFDGSIEGLASKIQEIASKSQFDLQTLSEKGLAVWPNVIYKELQSDFPRLRFIAEDADAVSEKSAAELQTMLLEAGLSISAAIFLHTYDDMAGFTKAQGE